MSYLDPAKRASRNLLWRRANKAHVKNYVDAQKRRLKTAAFVLLGNKCTRCQLTDPRVLQIDHIAGGGERERKSQGHSVEVRYRQILKTPEKYQLLCANCNWLKRIEMGEAFYIPLDPILEGNAG